MHMLSSNTKSEDGPKLERTEN